MYTIKQAAERSGVSVPVLRAWERRYGVVRPSRTAAGYRLYDDTAVRRITAMRRLVEQGWSPSSAAVALRDASDERIAELASPPSPAASATPGPNDGDANELIRRFVAAAAAFDAAAVEQALDDMFTAGSFETIVERLVMPALRALGDAWAAGTLDVASEHAASHATLRRLAAAFDAAGRPGGNGGVLVGLPPNARHELGALAFAVAARRAGLPVHYLGADVPVADWSEAVMRTRARAVVLAVPTVADRSAADAVVHAIRSSDPDVLVALGGGGAGDDPVDGAIHLPPGHGRAVDVIASTLDARR